MNKQAIRFLFLMIILFFAGCSSVEQASAPVEVNEQVAQKQKEAPDVQIQKEGDAEALNVIKPAVEPDTPSLAKKEMELAVAAEAVLPVQKKTDIELPDADSKPPEPVKTSKKVSAEKITKKKLPPKKQATEIPTPSKKINLIPENDKKIASDPVTETQAQQKVASELKTEIGGKTSSNTTAIAPEKAKVVVPLKIKSRAQIQGKITILNHGKKKMTADDAWVMINLEPLDIANQQKKAANYYKVDMKKKNYLPGKLIINVGDKVGFTNLDRFKHNVFSRSVANRFDLGTYANGKRPDVSFPESGLVKVYCNIHPSMATFIMVSNYGYTAISDREGNFAIADLPAGKYRFKGWNIRGDIEQDIFVKAGKNIIDLSLDAKDYKFSPHTNKYGKKYPEKSLFDEEQEFY